MKAIIATGVANFRSVDVILSVWLQEGQGGESLNQLTTRFGSGEALQQFLENQACCEDLVCTFKRASENLYGLGGVLSVATEGQRPDRRVYKQAHERRALSAL